MTVEITTYILLWPFLVEAERLHSATGQESWHVAVPQAPRRGKRVDQPSVRVRN